LKRWRESKNSIVSGDVSVGAKVRFTLTVRNDENAPRYSIPVRVYYVYTSPDDVWHSVIKVKEAEVDFDPLEEYQDWFDFTFANPGTYKFYLVVNGQEEDEKVITVNSQEEIEAWMICTPKIVQVSAPGTESIISCKIYVSTIFEPSNSVEVSIREIFFGEYPLYPQTRFNRPPKSVRIDTGATNLTQSNVEDTLSFVISADSSLATDIFSDEFYTMYLTQPDGMSYRIYVNLTVLPNYIGDDVTLVPYYETENTREKIHILADIPEGVGFILSTLKHLTIDFFYFMYKGIIGPPIPGGQEQDNNEIIGDTVRR